MTNSAPPRERIAPSAGQVRQAKQLLQAVPSASLDWTSEPGMAFLTYVEDLADKEGVPTAWLAERLGLDAGRLYATLSRHRKAGIR